VEDIVSKLARSSPNIMQMANSSVQKFSFCMSSTIWSRKSPSRIPGWRRPSSSSYWFYSPLLVLHIIINSKWLEWSQ
jgi:hypothetical protein